MPILINGSVFHAELTGKPVKLTAGTQLKIVATLDAELALASGPMYLVQVPTGELVKVFVAWTETPCRWYWRKLTEKKMTVTERRIRDLYSMDTAWREPETTTEARDMLNRLHDAMVAGQSLDDLGQVENDRAWNHLLELQARTKHLEDWIKDRK